MSYRWPAQLFLVTQTIIVRRTVDICCITLALDNPDHTRVEDDLVFCLVYQQRSGTATYGVLLHGPQVHAHCDLLSFHTQSL
jgi:hypothetical protein